LPDDEMMENLVWETINGALDELPPDQKEAFEMHELEGLSFQSMSEILGEPTNTLISRKHYAVKHLRKRLKNIYKEFKDE
jgi:RNA polymerase sigma factor (sigma-70 family)